MERSWTSLYYPLKGRWLGSYGLCRKRGQERRGRERRGEREGEEKRERRGREGRERRGEKRV